MEIGIYRSRPLQFHVSDDQRYQKISKTLHPDQYREENILSCLACSDAHLSSTSFQHQQTATLYATPSNKTSLEKPEGKKKKQEKKKKKNKRKEIVLLTMLMLWIHCHNSSTRQIQPFWDITIPILSF